MDRTCVWCLPVPARHHGLGELGEPQWDVPGANSNAHGWSVDAVAVVNAGPIGSLQVPAYHGIDARVEKSFRLSRVQKLTVRMNVYNLTNVNTVLSWTTASGASFMKPSGITGIAPPRLMELSAQYAF